jgi:hypothetical protein
MFLHRAAFFLPPTSLQAHSFHHVVYFVVSARQYTSAIAYMMIGVGVFYALLGIFCGQIVLKGLRDDYQERCGKAKETKRVADTYGLSVPGGNLPNPV